MSLTDYRRKRNFRKTPEPPARSASRRRSGLKYVIQKHAASHLHYDFRLEWEGVLKSWAVPKGPALDPSRRQLAVQVEDHPLAYGDFEGTIPQGEYGGGTVLLWDQGTWAPTGDAGKGLEAGKLKFELFGEKLQGRWMLVRMSGEKNADGRNWLLIKERDEAARTGRQQDILKQEPLSVLSQRDLPEIAASADPVWKSKPGKRSSKAKTDSSAKSKSTRRSSSRVGIKSPARKTSAALSENPADVPGAKAAKLPRTFRPQLATLTDRVPSGDDWLHEMKFDGYRILAFVDREEVRLVTRNGNDWTKKFPSVAAAVRELSLKHGLLDGEVVILRPDGTPDFQRLQNSLKHGRKEQLTYYVFDLPHLDGYDLTAARLEDRKQLLRQLLLTGNPRNEGTVRYSEHVQGQGADMAELACRRHLEGIVSKRGDSPYENTRSGAWRKTKCLKRQEFVIGGYTEPEGSRQKFGSLLLGYFEGDELRYCGKVGTGFTIQSLADISRALKARVRDSSPFVNVPRAIHREVAGWVEPELVAEVEFTEWTSDGRLRHPSFKGLRSDKPARKIVREEPMIESSQREEKLTKKTASSRPPAKSHRINQDANTVAGITITHPERVVYPDCELTKLEVARYYEDVAEWILPHVSVRPLSVVRCPQGSGGQCFFQKHFDGQLPDVVKSVRIREKTKTENYSIVQEIAGIVALVQFGVLEFHPWGSRADDVEHPDQLIFDLDPGEGTDWKQVIQGARDVRNRLSELGLESFVRTSGGKGLHVVLPITRRTSWDEAKEFCRGIAEAMAGDDPAAYTANMNKQKRLGKVFVDYHRNGRGATAVASYSTRARPGAPVATPLTWEELARIPAANHFTVNNLPRRLHRLKSDPWEGFFQARQSLTRKVLDKLSSQH